MKIVAVSWRDLAHPSAGGAEVLIDRLLRGLAHRGHQVTLVCGGPVSDHEYEVVDAGGTYSQYLRAPWVCRSRFGNADVIIDTENGLPYFTPIWRRKPSICLVHHVHTDQWQTRFPAPAAAVCRYLETRVMPAVYRNRTFVAISRSTAEDLQAIGLPAENIRIIESGVDVPPGEIPEKSQVPLFVSLNRLVPHKRIHLLLEAWEIACPRIPGRLVVLGDGPQLEDLRRQAATIPRVEVLGRVSEGTKQRFLAESWAVVSAAHHEGWGMSVMEAAAVGSPTLAIDAPGIRCSVVDGVTGVLIRASDEEIPRAFAESWIDLAQDGERRSRMGLAAHRRAAEFTWGRAVDRWLVVLEEVISSGTTDRPNQDMDSTPASRMSDLSLPVHAHGIE